MNAEASHQGQSAEDHSSVSDRAAQESGLGSAQLQHLADVACRAALAGASELRRLCGQLEHVREKGRAGDLVTEADTSSEAAVLAVLEDQTPEFGVLAEETGRQDRPGPFQWCVDPLDGTTNYTHGYPFYATSVGLTWAGLPLLGAIAVPAFEELFWAAPGLGAWCNDQPMRVSGCSSLSRSLLVTGFAYNRREQRDNNYAEFAWFTHRTRGVRRAGAASVDLAYVAAGRLDGYWEQGLSPWDLAAGVVLVEQAGGLVCAYDGGPFQLETGRLIACTRELLPEILAGLDACQPLPGACYGAPELDP